MENTERTGRKQLTGRVTSAAGDKTISVMVETYRKHPLYSKRVKQSKKYSTHDEQNTADIGDVVRIEETRPLSKTKHFRLIEIIEKAIKI